MYLYTFCRVYIFIICAIISFLTELKGPLADYCHMSYAGDRVSENSYLNINPGVEDHLQNSMEGIHTLLQHGYNRVASSTPIDYVYYIIFCYNTHISRNLKPQRLQTRGFVTSESYFLFATHSHIDWHFQRHTIQRAPLVWVYQHKAAFANYSMSRKICSRFSINLFCHAHISHY